MNIVSGYRSDKQLRDSFNALAEQTFGLNFEGWYQNDFWKENYDPHSVVENGTVLSNVSVNRTDLLIDGRQYRILQLGTVMTAEGCRGRGFGRAIMEHIEQKYADVDGIYLFANDSVVDYYPRFGFRPAVEHTYSKRVTMTGETQAEQVLMDGPAAWEQLRAAMAKSTFREGCPMVENPGLIFFYVSQFMQEAVYYIPHLDAWVIAEPEEESLTIHNIFADETVTIDAVAAAFGKVQQLSLGFAPADSTGWDITELHEEDTHFFVKGAVFEAFEQKKLRIPSLSHA